MSAPVPAARRRPYGGVTSLHSTADGGSFDYDSGDGDDGAGGAPSCALAQVAAGVLLAFMGGSLGYVLTGDATRSLLWLLGLWAGATVGVFATRPAVTGGGDGAAEDDATKRGVLAATAAGSLAGAVVYGVLLPVLSLDNLMAAVVAGGAGYASQGLATPHGRAHASLALLAAGREARKALTEVVRGGVGAAGGKGGASAGATSAAHAPGATFVGSSYAGGGGADDRPLSSGAAGGAASV